jgi:acylphosphatase
MKLFERIQSLLFPTVQMGRMRLTTQVALPGIRHLYDIQHAAQQLRLRGWLMINSHDRVEALLEGPMLGLHTLLRWLDSDKFIPGGLVTDCAWGKYKGEFGSLMIRHTHILVNGPDRRTACDHH